VRWPTSIPSSRAPTCPPGCSRSCATCSVRNTASAGSYAANLKSQPEQNAKVEYNELREALAKLPADQREALILVGASGFSYEEAAAISGCAVGTIKSRVNRARNRLAEMMSLDSAEDFGPDRETQAVMSGTHRR
jgi:RNA polymerase sigma-70 factor (ECF subfamily)